MNEPTTTEDPYQSEDYERFVASMVKVCHCAPQYRPCDGVLAGGPCDGMKWHEPEYGGVEDDYERD